MGPYEKVVVAEVGVKKVERIVLLKGRVLK